MKLPIPAFLLFFPVWGLLALPSGAQEHREAAEVEFSSWLEAYSEGKILLRRELRRDPGAMGKFRGIFQRVARSDDLRAAKALWRAAVVELPPDMKKAARLQASLGLVRDLAKTLIAGVADNRVDDWLLEIALRRGGKAASPRRLAALEILGMRAPEGMAERILSHLSSFPPSDRAQAILALERSKSPAALPVLLDMLKERDINVRISVIHSLCSILAWYSDETKPGFDRDEVARKWTPVVLEGLSNLLVKERVWQVKSAIAEGLVRTKNHLAIPVLIRGYMREAELGKKASDFLMETYHQALVSMTGRDLPRNRPGFWEAFWAREGKGFRYRPGNKKPPKEEKINRRAVYARYFNIDIRSKRILFVIDFSGSMREKVRLQGRYRRGREHVKYELVKKELEKVIRALPRDAICNVIFFNNEISIWREGGRNRPALVPMTDTNKSDLLQYVWETSPGGSTNLFGGLERALNMGERGVFDKYYKVAYDTLFVLSDGAPTYGVITDTDLILKEVGKINKLRRIKIHTIVFGDALNNIRFMKALAESNGGQFLHVQ